MLLRQLYYLPKVLPMEWYKKEEIENIVSKMLRSLLKDVYCTNRFYRSKFKNIDLSVIEGVEDLRILPFSTKEEMSKAFPEDLSEGFPVDRCVHESTSGSAGDILHIYHDQTAYDYYSCISLRTHRGYGFKPTYKMAYTRFAPFEKELYEYVGLFRRCYVPVHYPVDEQLSLLKTYRAEVISAYPSCLFEMARLIEEQEISIPHPEFIISHSELLTPYVREYVGSVFQCPVYNNYSSFEVHNIADQCTEGNMHTHIDNTIVEVIKDGEPAAPGEIGEIVLTNVHNRAMPFIRYKIGDMGAIGEGVCSCGRGLPLLELIEGRKDEYLILPSGVEISPRIFDPLDLIFHKYLTKFQIVQKKKGLFIIRVVTKETYNDQVSDKLALEARKCVPEPVEIDIVEVEDIQRTGRGKLRAVVSEVPK